MRSPQLRKVGTRQPLAELRLPRQHDLQQLRVRRFKIGKHSHGFEHGIVKVLRFVHDQHESAAGNHLREQDFVQPSVHGYNVQATGLDAQFVQKILEQLARIALGLKQENGARRFMQLVEELVQQSCLAHSRWSESNAANPRPSLIPELRAASASRCVALG